jgi:DNA-binding beta-propeller fold protein YncE
MATGAAVGASKLLVPGPQSDRTGVTPEGWRLTPAGDQIPVGPGPLAVAITPDGELVLVEDAGYDHHALLVLDARTGAIVQTFAGESDGSRGYYVGLVVSRDGSKAYASDGAGSAVRVFDIHRGRLAERPELPVT